MASAPTSGTTSGVRPTVAASSTAAPTVTTPGQAQQAPTGAASGRRPARAAARSPAAGTSTRRRGRRPGRSTRCAPRRSGRARWPAPRWSAGPATRSRRSAAVTSSIGEDVTAGDRAAPSPSSTSPTRRRRRSRRSSESWGEHDVALGPDDVAAIVGGARRPAGAVRDDRSRRCRGRGSTTSSPPTPAPPRLVRHEGWTWHLHLDRADDAPWARVAGVLRRPRAGGAPRHRRRRRAVGRLRRRRAAPSRSSHDGRGGDPPLVLDDVRQPGTGPPPPCCPSEPARSGRFRRTGRGQRPVNAPGPASTRRCQRDGVRAIARGLVLEHPAGEVAPAPGRRRGRGRPSAPRAPRRWARTRPRRADMRWSATRWWRTVAS